ncbi:hypothetical protein UFOVP610_13 [uncultured Caudovirales phage]|uniref:Uncharacterized protein n=1 Tax=uncultured Caudovirales phage TaxID=2100421 RepID=A0A6J5NA43_9CAUD|nr:hypothetical protein UFOVP610_13 [uncultured Caudovirales phage]
MELPSAELQTFIKFTIGIFSGFAGIVIGYFIKKEKRILKIEAMLDSLSKDIDGIALFIGTPRALGKQKLQQSNEDKDE